MMSSEEDNECFGLFTDDKSLLKTTLALNSSNTSPLAEDTNTSLEICPDLKAKIEILSSSTSPNLLNLDSNVLGDIQTQEGQLNTSNTNKQPPLANGGNNDLLYKEEKGEKLKSADTNTTTVARKNHHNENQAVNQQQQQQQEQEPYDVHNIVDEDEEEEEENNASSSVNVNTSTNDEGDDEVIFLFGQQQNNTLNTTSTTCTTATSTSTNTSKSSNNKNTASASNLTTTLTFSTATTTTTTTSTTTTKNNNNNTTSPSSTSTSSSGIFTNNTQQQVVTDVDDNLESSHKGAVNKTTSSLSSCGLKSFRNSLNTLQQIKNSNKLNTIHAINIKNNTSVGGNNQNNTNKKETKFKVNNNAVNSSLKIKLSKSPINSTNSNLNTTNLFSETQKQVNDFCSKLTNLNANNLNNSSNECLLSSLEDLQTQQQQQKSDLSVFSSLPNFISQLQNSTSPQLLGQTPAVLTPSTAAALMSSAAAAAAGAAGQALYGALINSSQQQQSSNSLLNNKQFSCNSNNLNSLHSPNSGSVSSSPNSSLLTGQFTAALGSLFGANGFGSAKMLNELFGRQMKQAQDATSGLPTSLDNAMLAAAMESATNAELLSAANLVNSLGLNSSNKLLSNNNNNTISSSNSNNHSNDQQQISPHTPTPKNRRTSNCSERSLEENGLTTRSQDLINSPPRTPSVGNSSTNGAAVTTTSSGAPNSPSLQQQNDLAHHMLRNILQGKKELMQLDQELRSVINQQQQMKESQDSTLKLNNNNSSLANNNNNNSESKENSSNIINLIEDSMSEIKIKSEPISQPTPMELMNGSGSQERRKSSDSEGLQSQHDLEDHQSEVDHMDNNDPEQNDSEHLNLPAQVTKKEADDILEDVELMGLNSRSDLESLASPCQSDMMLLDNSKDDLEEEMDKELNTGLNKKSDLKRARVENIVSTMRSSPSSQQNLQVNGCKKRKLYQPQQHAMERYVAAAAGLNFGLNLQSMMLNDDGDSDENESPQLQQKRNEKNALKSQLRSMQEQLAEMQQKYVQLCSRMEQESDCQEIEDNNSDSMEQEENNGDLSPSPSLHDIKQNVDNERASSTSPSLNLKNGKHLGASNTSLNLDTNPNNVLSQMMSKMISGKLHNPLVQHAHIQPSFNAPLPLLQHMPQLQTPEGGMPHPAISNAAAMYLGQQFFFEQEARMAKEAAEQQQQAQQQQLQQQQQQVQQQEQQEQQRRFEQEQQQRRKEEQAQQQQQQLQRQHQLQQLQQQQQEQQTMQQPPRPQLHHNRHHGRHNTALKTELSEKFNMLRSSSSSIMRMSGADLEGLADVLKSEITTSLSALVDTIVTRFVHQRRLFSKQSDSVAAAAEQLNKDLLLASQILDRKSPRTKQSDRSNNNSTNSSQSAQSTTGVNAGNNGTLLLVNNSNNNTNSSTNSLNNNPITNSNSNIPLQQQTPQQQLGHLHSNVSNTGPPLLTAGPINSVNVNVPQQHMNNPCQTLAPTTTNQVVTPNMAAQLNAQTCQSLIAAPRLNGSQLSFPSPAAAAAAAMGLQMHHAAAAAAMSAAAAASGQQQSIQALNQAAHLNAQNLNEAANSVNINVSMANLSSSNSNNTNSNNMNNLNNMNTNNNSNNNNNNCNNTNNNSLSTINIPPPHIRPSPTAAAMFQAPKTPQGMNPVAAAALYNSMTGGQVGPMQPNPFCMPEPRDQQQQQQQSQQQQQQQQQQLLEQNEALSLVVTPKKKRHKVTDTRITPRTVSRILAQDGMVPPSPQNNGQQLQSNQNNGPCNNKGNINNTMNPASLNHNTNNGNNCNNALNANNLQQQQQQQQMNHSNNSNNTSSNNNTTPAQSPSPRGQAPTNYHPQAPPPPPPPMMPVSLPTSVAIPNPSLHESQVFSPYSPFFNPHPPHAPPPPPPHGPHSGPHAPPTAAQMHHMKLSASPPGSLASLMDSRDGSPPLPPHPSTMLHPALLAAAHHGGSPDYSAHLRAAMDAQDRSSDCNSADMQFEGMQPTISFLKQQMIKNSDSLTTSHSSTLTPMHLRKAKLMFFWVRYPSSSVLKMYFPDIKFNKNNTAQLVKWFSNFREFYYIQMEKYARQAVTEGVKCAEDLHISGDSELYRVLNLHYNRNNHIEVPQNFRFVVEQTLREFFRAIQGGKDTEQSWKKSIYKIISRLDDPVPEYFKSPNFLEQLE